MYTDGSDDFYIFKGITGSVAYGLATPTSDIDRKGVFVFPVQKLLGLKKYDETISQHDPDFEAHEIGKFLRLSLACNPTILEMLFLPSDCIEHEDGLFAYLRANVDRFLHEDGVRNAYGGYARQQIVRVERRILNSDDPDSLRRIPKHIRHTFRLLKQGTQLLTTGELRVRLDEKEREFLFELGERPFDEVKQIFAEADEEFKDVVSGLPSVADFEWANDFLTEVRMESVPR